MRNINIRRLLLSMLLIIGVLQAILMYIMWIFATSFTRPCNTAQFDTLCGATPTPTWLLAFKFTLPFVFLAVLIALSIYGFRQLARNPKSMNTGLWGVIGLELIAAAIWYVIA